MAWTDACRGWLKVALWIAVTASVAVGSLAQAGDSVAPAATPEGGETAPPPPFPPVQPVAASQDLQASGRSPGFVAVELPAESKTKTFNVNFAPYVRFHLDFTQNLSGQDRDQADVTIGNFDPDTGTVTETQPRGRMDMQFGVERMLFGIQMSYDENWFGGVEIEAASQPQIGGANASGGSTINLSLAYVQCDFGAGFYNHSLALGRIPTLYVSYFDEVLWQHRFAAPGLMERNGLEYRTDDGVRVDGCSQSRRWQWGVSLTNGAPVGNETQFDGGKSFSGMLVAQPFDSADESGLGGFRLLALVNVLDRASRGVNPRISSAKRHLLLGLYFTGARFRFGLEAIPWGTRGRDARKPTSRDDGNVFGLSVWTVFAPQENWDVYLRLDLWDPNADADNHNGVFIATPTLTTTAPGQEQFYALMGVSRRFNPFVRGSVNLEFIDDSGKLQLSAGGAQKATAAKVDLSMRIGVSM